MSDAIVLTGAAMRGAFGAGVLSVLCRPETKARHGLDIRRVVGASSGALNGAFLAASIRQGDEALAGDGLVRTWIEDARLGNAFSPTLRGILGLRGLFDTDGMLAVMRRRLVARPGTEHVSLRLVVTNADGRSVGEPPITSYEQVVDFSGADFDEEPSLDLVRQVAAASSSVPFLFVPMKLTLPGGELHALDGGIVDDTPLSTALLGHRAARVFVVTPFPRVVAPPRLGGLSLASHLLDMLTQERLTRELRAAEAAGEPGRRRVEVVEIRPDASLAGHSFSAVVSRRLREQYVEAGVAAAERALAAMASTPG